MIKKLKKGLKKVIHINMHKIRANHKHGKRDPVITVKTYKSNDYGHEVYVDGPCKIVYRPDDPLSCGARVWLETDAKIEVSNFETQGSEEEPQGCQLKNIAD